MSAKKKVLVIDDESATLTMFRLFLTAYGYSVLTAEDGETGIRLVREHHPEIVFTDIKMPGMDGFEVLKQVKKTVPSTAVIVVTGHGDMDHVVHALNLNATDYINKPIGRSALDAALRRAEACIADNRPSSDPIQITQSSDIDIISIRRSLSGRHKALLMASLQLLLDSGTSGIVIAFENYSAVDGGGITLLTRLLLKARTAGIHVCITGLSENFKAIFEMVGITRVAVFADTIDDAASVIKKSIGT